MLKGDDPPEPPAVTEVITSFNDDADPRTYDMVDDEETESEDAWGLTGRDGR